MGISQMIRGAKHKFRDHQAGKEREKLYQQNIDLAEEKRRAESLEVEHKERQRLEGDLQRINKFNQTGTSPKNNKLLALGQGLAALINRGTNQSKGSMMKANKGLTHSPTYGPMMGGSSGVNPLQQGSQGMNLGGSSAFSSPAKGLNMGGSSPFNMDSKPKAIKPKIKKVVYYK